MITVTVKAGTEELAVAEAPDCESALVAGRTLWDDEQAAYQAGSRTPYYRQGLTVAFSDENGTTLLVTSERPR